MSQVLNAITRAGRYLVNGKSVSIVTDNINGPSTISGVVVSENISGITLINTSVNSELALFIPWTSIQYLTFDVPKVE